MTPLLLKLLSTCDLDEKGTSWRTLSQDVVHCEPGASVMFPSLRVEKIPLEQRWLFSHQINRVLRNRA